MDLEKLLVDVFGCCVGLVKANNQWNIAAELADDPMDSAFARALTGGIKGVAMVSWLKALLLLFLLKALDLGFCARFSDVFGELQFGSL